MTDWFSDLALPVSINPPGAAEMAVEFAWKVSDFPESELTGAMKFTNVGADIIVTRGVEVVAVHSLDAVKDGGLNYGQARERAAGTLLARMDGDEDLTAMVKDMFDR